MLGESDFSATGLIDNVNLEQDDARRAALAAVDGDWDPEGLYKLKQERDEAFDELAHNLPDNAYVAVDYSRQATKMIGRPQPIKTKWMVSLTVDCVSATVFGDTAAETVAKALRELASRKASYEATINAAVRVAAEVVA